MTEKIKNEAGSQAGATPIHSDFLPVVVGINRHAEFIKFVIWCATPHQFREPETQKDFATMVGVCEDTLTDWKRRPQFATLVYQAMKQWMAERVPDVIGGLYFKTQGEKCSAKDVEMFLRLAGMEIKSDKKK